MKSAFIMVLILIWTIGYPLFAWYSWDWPTSFSAFGWMDYGIAAVDLLIFCWVMNDLAQWYRNA